MKKQTTTQPRVSLHRAQGARLEAAFDRVPPERRQAMGFPTPEHPIITSASELRDFLRCRVRWWWRHQARLEPVERSEALGLGTMMHKILETWYTLPQKKRTVKAMTKIARQLSGDTRVEQLTTENRELVEGMCIGYAAWAQDEDDAIGLATCIPELPFELPLVADKSILIRGRIDNVFEPVGLKKTIACCEFKSAGQFRDKQLDLITQLSVYLWALRQQYPKMKRYQAYYTELRKQLPGPRVKADLFRRELIERTDEEIDIWVQDARRTALDMLDAAIYPTPNENCGWDCDFRNACLLRGSPEDLQHVLTTEFKPKEYRG